MSNRHYCSPAMAERLALIIEEAAEASQVCTKILRHGMHSTHPVSRLGNQELLEREIGDLLAVVELAIQAGDVRYEELLKHRKAKFQRVAQYLHSEENITHVQRESK
jgi:hypothetical protein